MAFNSEIKLKYINASGWGEAVFIVGWFLNSLKNHIQVTLENFKPIHPVS